MNYDPHEYCFQCQRVRPKETMGWASQNKKRRACDECIARIHGHRKMAREKSKGARS